MKNRSPFPPRIDAMVEEDQKHYIGWGYGYVSDSTLDLAYECMVAMEQGQGEIRDEIQKAA